MSVSQMPMEILEIIIDHLDWKSVKESRYVCSLWNKLAMKILRRRYTMLNSNWHNREDGLDIFEIFDGNNLPWSSCLIPKVFHKMIAVRSKFLSEFGPGILSCRFEDYDRMSSPLEMLEKMPNLVEVTLPTFFNYSPSTIANGFQLIHLKVLRINFSSIQTVNATYLEEILKLTTSTLCVVDIGNFSFVDGRVLKGIITLLTKVPKLRLSIVSVHEPVLSYLGEIVLNIEHLRLHSYLTRSCCHRNLIKSLVNVSSLHLVIWSHRVNASRVYLTLPFLPSLTILTLNLGNWSRMCLEQAAIDLVICIPKTLVPNVGSIFVASGIMTLQMTEFFLPMLKDRPFRYFGGPKCNPAGGPKIVLLPFEHDLI